MTAQSAEGSKKVALVIGNAKYEKEVALTNPENDAQDMAVVLSEIGFDVTIKLNADFETFNDALSEFAQKAENADVAIVFYAGHGIEFNNRNYLIPTDATLEKESQIRYKTIELESMEEAVSRATRLRMVFLDACRNNPFAQRLQSRSGGKRSVVGRGLAGVEPADGTVVAFSAKGGTTASDGTGRNSPYTKALLKYIKAPNLDVDMLLRKVRDDVRKDTNNQQEPFDYGSLPAETISLNVVGAGQAEKNDARASEPTGAAPDKNEPAREAWNAVKDSQSKSDLETIVRLFPGTIYATLAEGRIREMTTEPVAETEVSSLSDQDRAAMPTQESLEPEQWLMAIYPNLDFFGGDLVAEGIRVASVEQCAAACGNNLACRVFTYNARVNRCYIKGDYELAQRANEVVGGLFYKGRRSDTPRAIRAEWEFILAGDIVSQDLGSTNDPDYPSCFRSCRNNSQCEAVSFASKLKRNRCWLKTGYNQSMQARKGVLSARRINQTVSPSLVLPATPKG
ncbi:MAG TPA: caspase family protein [Ensifer sp.]|uniref:caspase family protein n=1 Tax=Ensifer sp. TaxID=1872086 RepID=UPI002E10CA25|nr:caspase family protein [Ensifer sp.]